MRCGFHCCCCCCRGITLAALSSVLASLSFFAVAWLLATDLVARTFTSFVLAVLYTVETILFLGYFVSLVRLEHITPLWNTRRLLVPSADFILSLTAGFIGSWMLPCNMILDLPAQFHLLSTVQQISVLIVISSLAVKLFSAVVLSLWHLKLVTRLYRDNNPRQYPLDEFYDQSPNAPLY
jgi:hypothetical protein